MQLLFIYLLLGMWHLYMRLYSLYIEGVCNLVYFTQTKSVSITSIKIELNSHF